MTVSRRRVAAYLADGLMSDRAHRIDQVAAWMVTRKRRHQTSLLVRDLASVLSQRGYLTATVTTARPADPATVSRLSTFVQTHTSATAVELTSTVDNALIGGLKLTLPDTELDASVATKLQTFAQEMNQ